MNKHRYFADGFGETEYRLGFVMFLSMAITGAISFWRDREKGTLELLLITPMSEWRIVWGRLRGIWSRYLPAFVFFIGLWWMVTVAHRLRPVPWHMGGYFGVM